MTVYVVTGLLHNVAADVWEARTLVVRADSDTHALGLFVSDNCDPGLALSDWSVEELDLEDLNLEEVSEEERLA